MLTTENFKKTQENIIKEANWLGGPLLMTHPVGKDIFVLDKNNFVWVDGGYSFFNFFL